MYRDGATRFHDRTFAGHEVAVNLKRFLHGQQAFVLAVAPNGVPVAASVARELNAPLDLAVSHRIIAPGEEDATLGAITPDRALVVNKPLADRLGLSDEDVDRLSVQEWAEAQRALQRYRRGRPLPMLHGYTAIVVDDGINTGYTMLGALVSARKMEPDRLVVAVPVISVSAMERVREFADELLALEISAHEDFSVGQYYLNYPQMSDQEIIWTLDLFWREQEPNGHAETF